MSNAAGDKSTCKNFDAVFRTELDEIRSRHNRTRRNIIPDDTSSLWPTTDLDLSGLSCSGGGVRSAAFCLGVLQGIQSKGIIGQVDYLSTVSGGGYIGTTMTIGMSRDSPLSEQDGTFPFGRIDDERRESPEVRHLRDNSRYLLQNGIPSAVSAVVIYLRGMVMNAMVLLPILLVLAAFLVALNPDTLDLTTNRFLGLDLAGGSWQYEKSIRARFDRCNRRPARRVCGGGIGAANRTAKGPSAPRSDRWLDFLYRDHGGHP